MAEEFSSASAGAPPAAGGSSTPSAPAPSSGGTGVSSPAPSSPVSTPDIGLRPLQPGDFGQQQAAEEQAPATPFDQREPAIAPVQEEFPDDDNFNRLPGEERASHWRQARERIAALNGQIQQAQQAQQLIQEWGGLDQVQASLGMLGGLFSPVTDEQGNVVYNEDGLPETTSDPWWQSLKERSPQTFVQLGEDWLAQEHSPGVRNWEVMFQHVFGLDPAKLDLYRSIQSPADAAQYQPAGDVSAYELNDIPPGLHDAYKATDPDMRSR